MWGAATDLQKYQGGRSFDDLKKFADANLKPMCGPLNIDLCDDGKKAEIKKYKDMSAADLDAAVAAETKSLDDAEKEMNAEVKKLQDGFAARKKNSGLGMMKAVKHTKPAGNDEL